MSLKNLKGKNVFITGATGGIGKAIAFKLAEIGCNLFLTSSNEKELKKLKSSLSKYNVQIEFISADLKDIENVYKVINHIKKSSFKVEILINSAGVFPNLSLANSSDEIFLETIDVNFRSIFLFTREFSKEMVENKWGRIVNIGSSSAYSGFQETSLYCASKHAVLGFSKSIHEELKEHNVRTYCISPSSTKSKMGLQTKGQDYSTFIDPEDIAEYVVFAISFNSNIVSNEIFLKRMLIK
jgi:3-oxoacyl-[acyl-carrier protein] reductase